MCRCAGCAEKNFDDNEASGSCGLLIKCYEIAYIGSQQEMPMKRNSSIELYRAGLILSSSMLFPELGEAL